MRHAFLAFCFAVTPSRLDFATRAVTEQFCSVFRAPNPCYKIYNVDAKGDVPMAANLQVGKWGSSLAVRIPKAIAEQCGILEGSAIEMDAQSGRIVMWKRTYDLADMLSRITADNLHCEQDTGASEGREQW